MCFTKNIAKKRQNLCSLIEMCVNMAVSATLLVFVKANSFIRLQVCGA